MTYAFDIKKQVRSIYSRGNSLIKKFRHCTDPVKIKLFKSYCTSIYACSLWIRYPKTVIRKVYRAYNNIFKHLMRIDDFSVVPNVLLEYNVNPSEVIIRKLVFSLRSCLLRSDNSVIFSLLSCIFFYSSPVYKHWESILGKV